jgi:hypothetical protein
MFELIAAVMGSVAMSRLAENNGDSALKWGGITFGACLVAFFLVPVPFLRILLALGAVFVAMTVTKKTYY